MAADALIRSAVSKFALAGLLLAAMAGSVVQARGPLDAPLATRSTSIVALADLPVQGQRTYSAILQGGPFRYEKDGSVFGNYEGLLPKARRGHYREYTVATPGVRHRGARRIVCAGAQTLPNTCWYTADHYASFKRIAP